MIEAELPDGRILEFPEGTSPDVIQKAVKGMLAPKEQPQGYGLKEAARDFMTIPRGVYRGVQDVTDTLVKGGASLADMVTGGDARQSVDRSIEANEQDFEREYGDSGIASVARFGGNVGATIPAGGVLAKGLSMVPGVAAKAGPLIEALRTGGASTGQVAAPFFSGQGAKQLGARVAGGATTGGASAALINPDDAALGAGIGGALPVVGRSISAFGSNFSPESLMQSALKPTIAQLKSGEAKTAVDTLLKYGINATGEGAERVKSMVGDVDKEILDAIAGSSAMIPKQSVMNRLNDVQGRFTSQVNPTSDLAAIQNVGADFANHPMITGQDIPVDLAQKLKQGTYKILDKKYGQVGTAETEAQKALARGLKEEIANAVPAVGPLNKKQSDLIKTMKVVDRRALMDENRNPLGIAGLSQSPGQLATMLADRSALVKSLAARGINAATPEGKNALMVEMLRQGVYRGAPVGFAD